LAQLTFPLQHKLAVYLPFFLPVSLPLIVGLLKEVKLLRKKAFFIAEKEVCPNDGRSSALE